MVRFDPPGVPSTFSSLSRRTGMLASFPPSPLALAPISLAPPLVDPSERGGRVLAPPLDDSTQSPGRKALSSSHTRSSLAPPFVDSFARGGAALAPHLVDSSEMGGSPPLRPALAAPTASASVSPSCPPVPSTSVLGAGVATQGINSCAGFPPSPSKVSSIVSEGGPQGGKNLEHAKAERPFSLSTPARQPGSVVEIEIGGDVPTLGCGLGAAPSPSHGSHRESTIDEEQEMVGPALGQPSSQGGMIQMQIVDSPASG